MAQDGFLVVSSNFKEFEKKFLNIDDFLDKMELFVEAGAQKALFEAIRNAPVNKEDRVGKATGGALGQSFSTEKQPQLGIVYALKNNKDYAPYNEFGTGTKVDVPSELKDYALEFKGEKKIIGQPAVPFMYPAAKLGQKDIVENVKKFIKSKFE